MPPHNLLQPPKLQYAKTVILSVKSTRAAVAMPRLKRLAPKHVESVPVADDVILILILLLILFTLLVISCTALDPMHAPLSAVAKIFCQLPDVLVFLQPDSVLVEIQVPKPT